MDSQTPSKLAAYAADPTARLRLRIDHAAHLLPAQGPITVFIHHNTLHAFEDLPFDRGVVRGEEVFGCQPWLAETRYRDELARGRILIEDVEAVVREDLGVDADRVVCRLSSVADLRTAMMQYHLCEGSSGELRWFIAETDALSKIRPDAPAAVRSHLPTQTPQWFRRDILHGSTGGANLPMVFRKLADSFDLSDLEDWSPSRREAFSLEVLWRICRAGVRQSPPPVQDARPVVRNRDTLLKLTGVDSDWPVNELLIRFLAAYLDQGLAGWPMPEREAGCLAAFRSMVLRGGSSPEAWQRGLKAELRRQLDSKMSPLDSIRESLDLLGIADEQEEAFITATLLALRGWGGMLHQVQQRGDRAVHQIHPDSLSEFLAIRLTLDRLSLAHHARESLGYRGPLAGLGVFLESKLPPDHVNPVEERAFRVFQLAQVLDWSANALYRLTAAEWTRLLGEIETFDSLARRRAYHFAFEKKFRTQTLDAVALHPREFPKAERPKFQLITCIDEREESFRRHVEEVEPAAETFGAAGFFSVAIYYRGADDAHFVPLCPIVVTPGHWVSEEVQDEHALHYARQTRLRSWFGRMSHRLHLGSRTFALGAVLTAGVGVLAAIPLMARVLLPRQSARMQRTAGSLVQPRLATKLNLRRVSGEPGCERDHQGFTQLEMTNIADRLLRDIGMTRVFSRLVLVIGHGSGSFNNPHKSAYDCGACGGSSGGPNARALAEILNSPDTRRELAARGLVIPDDTAFVGAFHHTCSDEVTWSDADRVPETHREEFRAAARQVLEAARRNAHERCRRFMSAPLNMTIEQAGLHVEARAVDLAQTRPECGHATNAVCVVGRRERTRGLYLDRRSFLVSYDPTIDDENRAILARIMGAIVPVCAGINLEYYFSYVDSPGWGCGSKLPHNITSLLGVMDGAASDLRTGLPWQMVEIHEPVRMTFVIENTAQAMLELMEKSPSLKKLVENGWMHLAVLDPDSQAVQFYRAGAFEPWVPAKADLPQTPSSIDWYRGFRDHLDFAELKPNLIGGAA